MKLLNVLKRLKWAAFWQLMKLVLWKPLFLWPTYKATKKCMKLSSQHFGKKHYLNGRANAFRHALWNMLIAKRCLRISKNVENVLNWTKKITDWHENAFFSKKLPMQMDFHNNQVGQNLFRTHSEWSEEQLVNCLLEMTEQSIKIEEGTNLVHLKNQLVYLSNDN